MLKPRSACVVAILSLCIAPGMTAQSAPGGADALSPIVGEWQSDTTDGNSARSSCIRTPQGGAVLCEQTITTPGGVRHVQDLFTWDPASSHYFLYVLQAPGDTVTPLPVSISGSTWTYGGTAPGANGRWWRTINEFGAKDSYGWRLESSSDGKSWTRVMGGMSRRVPPR